MDPDLARNGHRPPWRGAGRARGGARRRRRGRRRGLVGVTGAVVGITVVDLLTAVQASRAKEIGSVPAVRGSGKGGSMELTATTTIRKPTAEVYAFWRDL